MSYRLHVICCFMLVCLASALAPGCALDASRGGAGGPTASSTSDNDGGCPPDACGLNGTVLADARFGPLSLHGLPNARGISVVDFLDRDDRHLMVDIVDSALVGIDVSSGAVAAAGEALAGSRLILQDTSGHEAVEWALAIEDVGSVGFLSDERGAIPTYSMAYAPVSEGAQRRPLCPGGAPVALVKGERYDPRSLAVHTGDGAHWFYLACQDHLLWKAKRMSYDPERSPGDAYYTTAGQRRATLAMLAADYCGSGQRFTTPGAAIHWQNRAGWMSAGATPAPGAAVEAGWDEHGATCLGTPRHPAYARADVESACGRHIPGCTRALLAASEWVTWTP